MSILANRYGHTRPAEIAAKVEAARAAIAPAIEAPASPVPTAPVLTLVPAAPKVTRAMIAQWQAERATLRADLPMLRHYALRAAFDGFGPDFAEIEAVEDRLATLDDYLVFEPDFATPALEVATPLALAA